MPRAQEEALSVGPVPIFHRLLADRWREMQEERLMNALYWIAGLVALGLLLYLVVALLKPEWLQ